MPKLLVKPLLLLLTASAHADTVATSNSGEYQLGRHATSDEITRIDIAIGPAGAELPPGSGTAKIGAGVYARHCAACHGATGTEGPDAILVGGIGTLGGTKPLLTIGSYWPLRHHRVRLRLPRHAIRATRLASDRRRLCADRVAAVPQ